MMRVSRALLLLAALTVAIPVSSLARTRPTPTPEPTAAPVADPAVTRLVRQQFVLWQAGQVNKSLYDQQILDKLTDEKLAQTSKALAALGPLTDAVYMGPWLSADFPPGAKGYLYHMLCSDGAIYFWIALDPQGKIATILFKNRLDIENVTPSPATPPPSPP
jgi:hypothetical protein